MVITESRAGGNRIKGWARREVQVVNGGTGDQQDSNEKHRVG